MDSLRVADEYETPFEFLFPTSCGYFNYYKYGLDNLNEYMEETGRIEIRNNFFNRKTIYLIGEYDVGGQSNNCARYIQGEHRLSRSYIFYSYLGSYYGDSVYQITIYLKYLMHTMILRIWSIQTVEFQFILD